MANLIPGVNDLATKRPDIAAQWHPTKNGDLKPDMVAYGSAKVLWWYLPYDDPDTGKHFDFEWQAKVCERTIMGYGCPFLTGRGIWIGFNDLATKRPDIAALWHPTKNGDLKPEQLTEGSTKKVWLMCDKGHEWQGYVSDFKKHRKDRCPICYKGFKTSFPDQVTYFYVKKIFPDALYQYKDLGYELDIYIPSIKTGIEYDSCRYHKERVDKDIEKNNKCRKDGVSLIRIREENCPLLEPMSNVHVIIREKPIDRCHTLVNPLIQLFACLDAPCPDIDIDRDYSDICDSYMQYRYEHSLQALRPDLAEEWDYEKNGNLTPDMVSANSNIKVFWKCKKCGYVRAQCISDRNCHGSGCPVCSGHAVKKGYNDLDTIRPDLAEEWDYDKNGGLTPDMFTANSAKQIFWKCKKCGYSWPARIFSRNAGNGCPACAGKAVKKGYNDLASKRPDLAAEWDYKRNGDLTPDMFTIHSGKKVFWLCKKCGHSWSAYIFNRNKYSGCPVCAGRVLKKGHNDLTTLRPDIAAEWDYEGNGDFTPDQITLHTNKEVSWKCPDCGYKWFAKVCNRTKAKHPKCPSCSRPSQVPPQKM